MKQSKPLFNEFDETICILIDFLSNEFHSELDTTEFHSVLDTSKTFAGYKNNFRKDKLFYGEYYCIYFSEALKKIQ